MNVFTAALVAGLALPSVALAGDDPPATAESRGGEARTERPARERPARTGDEHEVRGRDVDASRRATGGPGASALRDGKGEAFAALGGGTGRAVGRMSAFRSGFDADGDGVLSAEEQQKLAPALARYHRSLRGEFDRDRDGQLDDREWQAFVRATYGEAADWHLATDRRRADVLRRTSDADGDGSLSKEETEAFAAALDADRMRRLERLDRDGDAKFGEKELAFARAQQGGTMADYSGGRRARVAAGTRSIGSSAAGTRSVRAGDGRN
jgi:hypothetical protein